MHESLDLAYFIFSPKFFQEEAISKGHTHRSHCYGVVIAMYKPFFLTLLLVARF